MKPFLSLGFLLILFSACSPKEPQEVLARVDHKIYYPQRQGLESLSCKVYSPYIDEMFERLGAQDPATRIFLSKIKVEVNFYWKKGAGSKYVIKGLPKQPYALRYPIWEVFKGTDFLIVPPTEEEQFKDLQVGMKKEPGLLKLTGINPDSNSEVSQYDLVVKTKNWLILERKYYAKEGTSTSNPEFKVWKRKRYPVRIKTYIRRDPNPDFRSEVELDYQEVKGFWLIKKMVYKFELAQTGAKVVGPVELIFDNCQVNLPLSQELFDGNKVSYIEQEPIPASGNTSSP